MASLFRGMRFLPNRVCLPNTPNSHFASCHGFTSLPYIAGVQQWNQSASHTTKPVWSQSGMRGMNQSRLCSPLHPAILSPISTLHTSATTCQQQQEQRMFTQQDAGSLLGNLKHIKRTPIPALVLGLAGLTPFVGVPIYMVTAGVYCSTLATIQVAYGASILSFLGGVRWGFTLYEQNPVRPDWVNLGYSVLPSLVAWGGFLLPNPLACITMIIGLSASAYCDMAMFGYPAWFKGFRFLLSLFAVLSLITVFSARWLLPTTREKAQWKEIEVVKEEDTSETQEEEEDGDKKEE